MQTGNYLQEAYAVIRLGGVEGDEQTSIIYDARTGEVAVDAPAGTELTSINIDSAAGILTGESAPINYAIKTVCIFLMQGLIVSRVEVISKVM